MFPGAIFISLFAFHSGFYYVFSLLGVFMSIAFGCICDCV